VKEGYEGRRFTKEGLSFYGGILLWRGFSWIAQESLSSVVGKG
jgi:hypothetical protein